MFIPEGTSIPEYSVCKHHKELFIDHCRWQNFLPSLLHLVDRLYTVIHKTQKTRTKVLPSAMVGKYYFNLYYCHARTYFGGKLFWKLLGPIQPLCTGWQVESTFIPRSITTLAFAFKASSSQ